MSRHLLLRVYPTYRRNIQLSNQVRLLSTSGNPNPGKSDQKSHYGSRNSSSSNWKICGIAIGIISSVLGINSYLKKRDDAIIFPEVFAATIAPSGRRKEFNVIADVVEVAAPAVVYIEIKDMTRYDPSGQHLTVSNGSGFIIEPDGLILTNAHVVTKQHYSQVQVKLADGRMFPGVVEDVDFGSDLATVRISSKNLPVLKLGESSNLRSGEWVVALGSPLALSNTVTAGVVSSTKRDSKELGLTGRDIKYIQTDAAITFGNSGGPLVNLDGEAIGINSMKVSAGISFAIPIDYVKNFLNRGKERIRMNAAPIRRKYVGITMVSLTQDIIQVLRHRGHPMPSHLTGGVLVWKVILGSPAYAGGLLAKDIITEIEGKPIKTSTDVYYALAETEKDHITMVVYRGQEKLNIKMYPEDFH